MFVGEVLRNVDSVHLFRNLWREGLVELKVLG